MGRARPFGPSSPRGLLAALVVLGAASLACQQTVVFERADGSVNPAVCSGGHPVDVMPEFPVIVVALDRTTTMNEPYGSASGAPSKLWAARTALHTLLDKYQEVVQFGYIGFPGVATGTCFPETCCSTIETPVPTLGIASYIDGQLGACDDPSSNCASGTERPTAQALGVALQALTGPGAGHGNRAAVVLLTDDDPGCAGGSSDPCYDASSEVSALATTTNAHTSVIGLGTPPDDRCLKQLASTGTYQNPASTGELQSALEMVIRPIATAACRFDLHSNTLNDPSQLHVYLNNMDLPRSDTNGWSWNGPQLVLNGDACDTFLSVGLASQTQSTGALFYDCGSGSGPPH